MSFSEPSQRKRLGQVFLKDGNMIERILRSYELHDQSKVLEVGCGAGALSIPLSERCASLVIVELDPQWLDLMTQRLGHLSHVRLIHSDILDVDLAQLGLHGVQVLGNVPYYLSAKLLQWLQTQIGSVTDAIWMFQKEFADKLLASPGTKSYTSLTVFTQFYFEIELLVKVPKTCFQPVPKVDSSVIRLRPRPVPYARLDEPLFFGMIKTLFWARRKTVASCLAKGPFLSVPKTVLEREDFVGFAGLRGEVLGLDDFIRLYDILKDEGAFLIS
ncbi:MAG: ribosomal RNA small subunit methyltransferase A [Actinobacteria bacterium]|nr:ribosomal RNA small subunit methyltransferase A [Actinomycetota bacterium]|tara:strand:+ start:599 stop:1417 length:819 start_codon:yes stop_codon:yes gene_type:complete